MIRRLILENFMAHRHTVLELAEGVTVLRGPNNCGKSAVLEALRGLAGARHQSAARSRWFVRHGCTESRVRLEMDDHTIEWIQPTEKGGYYVIDKQDYVGSKLPEEFGSWLRLSDVEGINPHFGEQKEPLFLLNQPAATVARFFSSASDVRLLLRMREELNAEKKAATQKQNQRREDLQKTQARIGRLEAVPAFESELVALDSRFEALGSAKIRAQTLRGRIAEIEAQIDRWGERKARADALLPLDVPPPLADTEPLRRTIDARVESEGQQARLMRRNVVLHRLAPTPTLHDVAPGAKLLFDLRRGERAIAKRRRRQAAYANLAESPVPLDLVPLRDGLRAIKHSQRHLQRLVARAAAQRNLTEPPALREDQGRRELAHRLEALQRQVGELQQARIQIESQLERAREEIRAYIRANPVCPVCNQTLNESALLRGGVDA